MVEAALRLVEMAAQVRAFGSLNLEVEHELIIGIPRVFREEIPSCFEIGQGGLVGGRELRLSAGVQVQPRQLKALGIVRNQTRAAVQVVDDVKKLLVQDGGIGPLQEQTADSTVDELFFSVRDQGVGRLLNTVMQK